MTRVHPRIQQVDGFALATAVDPGNQDHDREILLLQYVVLDIEQFGAQLRHLGLEGLFVDFVTQLC